MLQAVREQKIRNALEEKGAAMLADLDGGKATMKSIAEAGSLKLEKGTLLARNAEQPSRELVNKAFTMPPPKPGKPVYSGELLASGDYALIELQEVQQGDYDALPEAARKQAWQELNRIDGSIDLQMVLGELRSEATIRIPGEEDL